MMSGRGVLLFRGRGRGLGGFGLQWLGGWGLWGCGCIVRSRRLGLGGWGRRGRRGVGLGRGDEMGGVGGLYYRGV